ncbi:MAG: hypothetical protein DYG89_37390 [Caldilinea sp. CFX5]|nr:hypothetical protein [Caldilinea sp. CFX5]
MKTMPAVTVNNGVAPLGRGRTIALFPGAFRPPHVAHFAAVQSLLQQPTIDEVVIIIADRNRLIPGTTQALPAQVAQAIWSIYVADMARVRVEIAPHAAITHALSYFTRVTPADRLLFCIGEADQGRGDDRFTDMAALSARTGIAATTMAAPTGALSIRSTALRAALAAPAMGQAAFLAALPTHLTAEQRAWVWQLCLHGLQAIESILPEKLGRLLTEQGVPFTGALNVVKPGKVDPVFCAQRTDGAPLFVKYAGDTVDDGVVGQPLSPKPAKRLDAERRALKWLQGNPSPAVQTPKVELFDKATRLLVLSAVCPAGRTLLTDLEQGVFLPAVARAAARFLRHCHHAESALPALWSEAPTDEAQWRRMLALRTTALAMTHCTETSRAQLTTLSAWSDQSRQHRLFHLDYTPQNIRIDQTGIGVIDFELSSTIGDPAYELGLFLGHYLYWGLKHGATDACRQAVQAALAAYFADSGLYGSSQQGQRGETPDVVAQVAARTAAFAGAGMLALLAMPDQATGQGLAAPQQIATVATRLLAQGLAQKVNGIALLMAAVGAAPGCEGSLLCVDEPRERFAAPYCYWTPAALLVHFQTRPTPHYFALRDREQASEQQIDQLLRDCFVYNDEAYHLPTGFDWTVNPSPDREWLILLHKFYFAPGLGAEYARTGDERYLHKWLALTAAWIDTVPLTFLSSDVTGRRVQNWIFAHYYFVTMAQAALPRDFYACFLRSLQQQVTSLCANLTPARNHRTIELYAIFMAAVVFPEFADAQQWRHFAQEELLKNIQADLRPDGVHCEQSTDYHHLVVKNYLGVKRLAAANGITLDPRFDELLQKALDFAMVAHKPDGAIPALSDGDSRSFLDLLQQGADLYDNAAWRYVATQGRAGTPPTVRSHTFPAGGYTILRSGWGEGATSFTDERYLIFDCGPLGEGNHGHLDLLSFEAAAFGQSLIVDPGRYTYHEPHPDSGAINWRARFRGTAYHNTVQVDGREQTAYRFHKKKFKLCGPEPAWTLRHFQCGATCDFVHGAAASAEYDVIHERIICFAGHEYWIVTDILRAPSSHRYDLRFHLADTAAGQTTLCTKGNMHLIHAPHLLIAQPAAAQTTVTLQEGYVSRSYGTKAPAPVVCFTRSATTTCFHTVLYPYADRPPSIQVAAWPVRRQGRCLPADQGVLLQIMFMQGERHYVDTVRLLHDVDTVQPPHDVDTVRLPHDVDTVQYQYHYTRQDLSRLE